MTQVPNEHGIRTHNLRPDTVRPVSTGTKLTQQIVDAALKLGFSHAGVSSVFSFEAQQVRLADFIQRGFAGEMHYLSQPSVDSKLIRGELNTVLPGVKSYVSVALPYASPEPIKLHKLGKKGETPNYPTGPYIAQYARGEDYHHVVKELLHALADSVAELVGTPLRSRACVDTAPLFERDLAVACGLGFIGKNTLAIVPGLGSRFVLGELLLDCELSALDAPTNSGCGSCRACLDICPTGAFVHDRLMDATRCISYLTIEKKGEIPRDLRKPLGTHIFGCDLCQAVCPYNHKTTQVPTNSRLQASRFSDLDASRLLHIGSSQYRSLVKGTALRRITREQFCRNLAVAMGNSGQETHVDSLKSAVTEHPYPLVKEHATWALVRLAEDFGLLQAQLAIKNLCAQPGDAAELIELERVARARTS